jgi:hypothetical protein
MDVRGLDAGQGNVRGFNISTVSDDVAVRYRKAERGWGREWREEGKKKRGKERREGEGGKKKI